MYELYQKLSIRNKWENLGIFPSYKEANEALNAILSGYPAKSSPTFRITQFPISIGKNIITKKELQMLWIEPWEVVCLSTLSALIGGCLMAIIGRNANRMNMNILESYWNSDIKNLRSSIANLEKKLSTKSVVNTVRNTKKSSHSKGYSKYRSFKHSAYKL